MSYKIAVNILLFLIIIIFGVVLNKSEKPYHSIYFNLHKLASVAIVVITAILVRQFLQQNEMTNLLFILILVASLATIALMVSGGMLGADKYYFTMQFVHKIANVFFILSFIGIKYYLLK